MHAHDALLLLRNALAIPKVLYILHTAPCFLSPLLHAFDDIQQSALSEITNVCLGDDNVWIQASLPVGMGGIGLRRAAELAPSAFLASAAGSSSLITQILPAPLQEVTNIWSNSALLAWQEGQAKPPPTGENAQLQRAWDKPTITSSFESLLGNAQDSSTRARLLAVASKESGVWLNALPLSTIGLRMDDDTIRVAVSLRLNWCQTICEPHTCSQCGSPEDDKGTHALSCRFSRGRASRHSAINTIIKKAVDSARLLSHLEPQGLSCTDGKRTDGMTIEYGTQLAQIHTCSPLHTYGHE